MDGGDVYVSIDYSNPFKSDLKYRLRAIAGGQWKIGYLVLAAGCETSDHWAELETTFLECSTVEQIQERRTTEQANDTIIKHSYSDGKNTVAASKGIPEEVANAYLVAIPVIRDDILNLFEIESPFSRSLQVTLYMMDDIKTVCGEGADGCAGDGPIDAGFCQRASM